MAQQPYHRASHDQLAAFLQKLSEAPWKEIDLTPYQDAKDHLSVPVLALLKMRLTKKLNALVSALNIDSSALIKLDFFWDTTQRRLKRRIDDGADDPDPNRKEAARRLTNALLLGDGLAQTKLSLREEVNHGRKQLAQLRAPKEAGASTPSLSEDAELLELKRVIEEIEKSTSALEEELKRIPDDANNTSRFARVRLAFAECTELLQHADAELEAQLEAASQPETRERLTTLLHSLRALIPEKKAEPKPKEETPAA